MTQPTITPNSDNLLAMLLPQVGDIARDAGQFIKSQLHKLEESQIKTKDLNSLVSYVDVEAENRVVKGLRVLLPDADFLTEEGTVSRSKEAQNWCWVIDPLDGTTNFIHRIPFFSVSIALKYQEKYVLGVVFDVMQDELFSAAEGVGAYSNNVRIHTSSQNVLADALLATGFPYNSFEHMEAYLSLFRDLFQSTRGLRRLGSAALDLCYVAKGSFAGFYEYGLNEWDIAAGICILKEAGGQISDFQGGNKMVAARSILATNSHLHQELLRRIKTNFNASTER